MQSVVKTVDSVGKERAQMIMLHDHCPFLSGPSEKEARYGIMCSVRNGDSVIGRPCAASRSLEEDGDRKAIVSSLLWVIGPSSSSSSTARRATIDR